MRNPFKNYYYVLVIYSDGQRECFCITLFKWCNPDQVLRLVGKKLGFVEYIVKI